jgi:hypothetical protein
VALASVSCIFKVFIEGAIVFIGKGGAVIFINKGSLAVGGKSFKTAKAGVNGHNLRRRLIIYKLKGPSVSINSLISISNHSVWLSLWAILYSTYSTNLLFLLKTHTLLCRSSYLNSLIADL